MAKLKKYQGTKENEAFHITINQAHSEIAKLKQKRDVYHGQADPFIQTMPTGRNVSPTIGPHFARLAASTSDETARYKREEQAFHTERRQYLDQVENGRRVKKHDPLAPQFSPVAEDIRTLKSLKVPAHMFEHLPRMIEQSTMQRALEADNTPEGFEKMTAANLQSGPFKDAFTRLNAFHENANTVYQGLGVPNPRQSFIPAPTSSFRSEIYSPQEVQRASERATIKMNDPLDRLYDSLDGDAVSRKNGQQAEDFRNKKGRK